MIDRRALLTTGLGASAALLLPRAVWAQMQPGPPTPGVIQATIADPAPSPDASGRISGKARGKTLMVVNKAALTIGFYDAVTGMQQALFALPSRPHELLVARDGRYAYVSIYGDGIYGQNPHPGNQIAIIDIARRTLVGFLSTGAVLAPHGLAEAPDGTIWATCDIGAAVVGFDPRSQKVIGTIQIGGRGGHWIVADRSGKAYLSNRAGPGIPVLDLVARRRVGTIDTTHAITGLDLSPDGRRLFAVDDQEPALLVVDTGSQAVLSSTMLAGLPRPTAKGGDRERRVKATPDGRYAMVSDYPSAGLVRVQADAPARQSLLLVQHGPMSMAFSPDGRTAWVCDHDAGAVTIVDVATMTALLDFKVGEGCETAALVG